MVFTLLSIRWMKCVGSRLSSRMDHVCVCSRYEHPRDSFHQCRECGGIW